MSDTEGTGGSDAEEILEFKCRKCPGKTFTAAEKDAHRMFHREQKEKEKKKKPGPKSKTRASARGRDSSPAPSEATLFQAITTGATGARQPEKRASTRRKADEPPAKETGAKKRKSKKKYDDPLEGDWPRGNGA